MSTVIKSELSKNNKYWVPKYRYFELKYFCLQYLSWKKSYLALDSLSKRPYDLDKFKTNNISDPTAKCAESREKFFKRIEIINAAINLTIEDNPFLKEYLFKAVTEGYSYNYLKTSMNIPCGKDMYYKYYRKFFWLLNKYRD